MSTVEGRRRRSNRLMVVLLLVAIAVTVASAVNQVVFTSAQQDRNVCYQQALRELNTSLVVAREAAKQDREQLRILVLSFISPTRSQEGSRVALDRYLAALDDADRRRLAAPLPDIRCG